MTAFNRFCKRNVFHIPFESGGPASDSIGPVNDSLNYATFLPGRISGRITAPPSKSYSHRAIILSALSKDSVIINPLLSEDTKATISALCTMGADISIEKNPEVPYTAKSCCEETYYSDIAKYNGECITDTVLKNFSVNGSGVNKKNDCIEIDVKNSGTTLRLLTGLASTLPVSVKFDGDESIRRRPMSELLGALRALGAQVISENDRAPFIIKGPISSGDITIPGNVSSQFISSLIIALTQVDGESSVTFEGKLNSEPYVDITLDIMEHYGLKARRKENTFYTYGIQKVKNNMEYIVPGDYSSAAFFIVAGALASKNGESVRIDGLGASAQGDRKIVDIMKKFNANISLEKHSVTISKSSLEPMDIDISMTPDLFPILSVAAAHSLGNVRIYNAETLRHKECDRINAMYEMLKGAGVKTSVEGDSIMIRGSDDIKGSMIKSYNDHRIFMSGAVLSLISNGKTTIDNPECFNVSYPQFMEHYKRLIGHNGRIVE